MIASRGYARSRAGIAAWTLAFLAPLATRADGPKSARWIGPDAFLYVESSRPETLLDRLASPRVSSLRDTFPGYGKFLARPDVKFARGAVEFLARSFGTTWDQGLRDLLGGGVVAAMEGTKGQERIVLIVTPRDASLLDRVHAKILELARADAKLKGKPDPIAEADYGGAKTYRMAPGEAHAILDGALILTNNQDLLRATIDRAGPGDSPRLADDPTFVERRKAADPQAFAWGLARVDRLRERDPSAFAAKPDPGAVFTFGLLLEAIRSGDWATASLTWTDARLAAEIAVGTPKGGYSPALARFLPPKGEGASRPIVPRNAIGGVSLWRDFAAIWDVRAEILPPETVQGLAQLDTQAGTFFGGRDFGTGVLGALGAHWTVAVADQDFADGEPVPDVKYPAVAAILELQPGDEEFATRLMSAFQTFIGLANLGAAQTKAPPLMLGSESFEGVTIATSRFEPALDIRPGTPIDFRHNFSPSAARVGQRFILSTSRGLARDLVTALKAPPDAGDALLLAEADGPALGRLAEKNRASLVTQNMLEKGNTKDQADAEVHFLVRLLDYLGHASLAIRPRADGFVLTLEHALRAE